MQVNAVAPGILAEEADRLGSGLIHFSTDYVFDGTKGEPYTEDDTPNPLNVYGETKLEGEKAISSVGDQHLILRTSWVYSLRRECFVTKVLRWARDQRVLSIATDQVSTPTWCRSIAIGTAEILSRSFFERRWFAKHGSGIFHLAALGPVNRYEWAKAILLEGQRIYSGMDTELVPAESGEFRGAARRPPNTALDCRLLKNRWHAELSNWRLGLNMAMSDFRQTKEDLVKGR